jgi:hypothetical protein
MKFSLYMKQAAAEPLLHFLLLGTLVFGVDHFANARRGDQQTITISPEVKNEAREVFKAGMKREPSAADMKQLIDRWVDNEVLYREGVSLGLDRGDSSIRERVIFKALSVTQSGINLPPIDEAGLRVWFETRHDRYDLPERFDFLEAVVAGDNTPQALDAFVAALNGQGASDAQSGLRVFKDRPRNNLVQSYGTEFTDALRKLTPGKWQALPSSAGVRVVRLESLTPGTVVKFEDLKDQVLRDWKDDTLSRLSTQAVREMGKKYQLRNVEAKS